MEALTLGGKELNTFYTITALVIVVLLLASTGFLFLGRKSPADWWLAVFLISLVLNTAWAFVGPILAGMQSTGTQFEIGNLATRLTSVIGYGALLGFVIVRKRESSGGKGHH